MTTSPGLFLPRLVIGAVLLLGTPLSAHAQGEAQAGGADTPAVTPALPVPKALPPDLAGECAWTGKRVVSLLSRDDVDTARRFLDFYQVFGCRQSHIGPTLRCVVTDSTETPPDESATARIDRCWSAVIK